MPSAYLLLAGGQAERPFFLGPVCVPLGLTPLLFFGPQPGLYWLLPELPLLLPLPFPAMTPPVPPAMRATARKAASPRDLNAIPFGREDPACAIALVLILSSSRPLASSRSRRSRSSTSRRSSGRFGPIAALYERRPRFLTGRLAWRVAALALLLTPTAHAQEVSPRDQRDWDRAVAIADRSAAVREQRERYPGLRSDSFAREGRCCMTVWYSQGGAERAVAKVDLRTGAILEQWTGHQVAWEMARGYEGDFGRSFNSPWVLIPLGLLFLAPFLDPRRPLRLLHLDLLVLLAFGASHVFFNEGEIGVSVPLVYPVLLYLLARMVAIGFRGGAPRGPLVPFAPAKLLLAGVVVLLAARIALNVADSNVVDVGYAGVIGADHIADGRELYDGRFAEEPPNADTYGPVNYLLYVPFLALGWSGEWDDVPAAHGAAIAFDLLVVAALLLAGSRLRPGTVLGPALAFAWVAYPYSLFPLMTNSNDALVGALAVLAVATLAQPAARGALVALGAAAKFAPLALAPLFARNAPSKTGQIVPKLTVRDRRGLLLYVLAVLGVLAAAFAPFLPPGGVTDIFDRTIGFQLGRESPFSVWGQAGGLAPLHAALKGAAVALALAVAFVPRRRTPAQTAALAAAILIALQLAAIHWFYLYVAWFAPLVLVALFARQREPV